MKYVLLLLAMAFSVTRAAAADQTPRSPSEFLVLGGGCFWCTEAAYELVPGVLGVVSGYAGGHVPNPTYEQVCDRETGHAEVIQVEYDPTQTSVGALLDLFWVIHDPTTLNRQGGDEGPQYRSIILYRDDAQKAAAEKATTAAQSRFSDPIVTEIAALKQFYAAEDYHQDYFRKNPNKGYCRLVVKPKVDKMKKALKSESR